MITDNAGIYRYWYNNFRIQYEIISLTYRREMALLTPKGIECDAAIPVRMMKCHSVQHFQFILKALHILEKPKYYNFYRSVATYKNGIPNQTMNLAERDNSAWNAGEHWKNISEYDFIIDIDAPTHNEIMLAHESAMKISIILCQYEVSHSIIFTGMGFHIWIYDKNALRRGGYSTPLISRRENTKNQGIAPLKRGVAAHQFIDEKTAKSKAYPPSENMPLSDIQISPDEENVFNPDAENNMYGILASYAKKFYDSVSEMVDTTIYDSRRVAKIPYTLSIYGNDIYICWALTQQEFFDFKLDDYTAINFINNFRLVELSNIKGRGIPKIF